MISLYPATLLQLCIHKVFLVCAAPRPTLKDLVKVRVKSWYNLGLQLDIEDDELDTIERNHPQDWERCKRNMFKEWLRKCPQASYQQLVQAMVKSGDVSEAHCLCRKYGESCNKECHLCTWFLKECAG